MNLKKQVDRAIARIRALTEAEFKAEWLALIYPTDPDCCKVTGYEHDWHEARNTIIACKICGLRKI